MQATVVTARGEILTTSTTENADLFWAIRGAGCNFGVVTEFVLRLHPQRRTVFGGIVAYQAPETPKAVSVLADSWNAGLSGKEAVFYAQTTDPAGNVCVSHSLGSSSSGTDSRYIVALGYNSSFLEWLRGRRARPLQAFL